MCTSSTTSAADNQAGSDPGSLQQFWQTIVGSGPRRAPETIAHLSPHLRRDIGLDGRATGRRNDFTSRHGLAP